MECTAGGCNKAGFGEGGYVDSALIAYVDFAVAGSALRHNTLNSNELYDLQL